MKSKITLFLVLIILPILSFMGNAAFAQTVTGTPSNESCPSTGIITAKSTGLGTVPEYQLLKSGIVIAPLPGDVSRFANSTNGVFVFGGLENGTYTVKARAGSGQLVYTSSTIVVTDGYINMKVAAQAKTSNCPGGTAVINANVSGGKSPFTYKIALQTSSDKFLQTSVSTNALSFAFDPLTTESYTVSVTDACGQTVTGATSISSPTVALTDIKVGTFAFPTRDNLSCTEKIKLRVEGGFRYIATNTALSGADAALFSWKIKYKGQFYGKDTNGDGYSDLNGGAFSLATTEVVMPLIVNRADILNDIDNVKIVIYDLCGKSTELSVIDYNKQNSYITLGNCGGTAIIKSLIGKGLDCLPVTLKFTNSSNSRDTHEFEVNDSSETFTGALTPGATYNVTYIDGEGYTTNLYRASSSVLSFSATSTFLASQYLTVASAISVNYLDYGDLTLRVDPAESDNILTYTVTASSNPKVPVNYTYSAVLGSFQNRGAGFPILPSPNPTDPAPFWPKGNYTLEVKTDCGVVKTNVVVQGRTASLTDGVVTPICGGFNYVMKGTFDEASAYEVIIVSGPSNKNLTKDLVSTTESKPFEGLSYGTYTFGLRIKGGTAIVLEKIVTYDPGAPIKIDRARTGGFVCTEGSKDGTLTISATTNAPTPNNTLLYAISNDGGVSYFPKDYQSSNYFEGLSSGTYFFKVKDGCPNEITEKVQIGVASAPIASANGLTNPVLCKSSSGTVQLDVDIINATYTWTGPGITDTNKNLKNPEINYADLIVGANNYTCKIVLGAPCNTSNEAKLTIFASLPVVKITNPLPVCYPNTIDLTASAIKNGSDANLVFSYYSDSAATIPVQNPNAVDVSNTYYIKAKNSNSCETIVPVIVKINPLPTAAITYQNQSYCNRGSIAVTQTGLAGGTYSGDAGLAVNASTGLINLASSTAGIHTVTYTFSDGTCSNTAITSINIIETVLPTALPNVTAQCSVTTIAAPTLTDPCAGTLTATTATSFPITKSGDTDVTWVYNYGNGYTQSVIQKVSIKDTMAPVVGLLPDLNAQCSLMPVAPTATDNCDSGIITGITTTLFPITKQGLTVISWTFKDSSGNSSTALQNVNIKDTTAPVVPVLADITGQCSVTPKTPTTSDNCSGTISGKTKTVFPITKEGKTVVTWTFDDGNGNIVTADQNVIISNATLVGTASTICSVDGSGYVLKLNVIGDAPYIATGTGAPGTWFGNEWTSGNISAGTNYNVNIQDINACNTLIVADTAPVCCAFEVVAPTFPETTITCYNQLPTAVSLTKAEFEALGNGNGTIGNIPCGVIEITASNSEDPGCNGNVVRTYTVTEYADTNNNKVRDLGEDTVLDSITFTQIFKIEKADFVMPANAGTTVTCASAATIAPTVPLVTDNCGNVLAASLPVVSPLPACNGDVDYTYTFTDCAGNMHDWVYTYTIDNTIAPTGKAPADVVLQCIDDIPVVNTNAVTNTIANCKGAIVITVEDTNNGGKGCKGDPYIVTRTFTLTDCGGLVTNLVQKITVEDATAPVFVETLPTNMLVDCADKIPVAVILTAIDNCSAANVAYDEVRVNGNCSGNYQLQRTWTATDSCGNENSHTQLITVTDNTAPNFVESLPEAVINATCETIPSAATLTASDTCGIATVDYTETKVDGDCSSKYDLVRLWVASDDCGNQNVFTQTIHVSCLPEIYNAISPNGDGLNDTFTIGGIDCYPNNNLRIYNRYGVLVYEKQGYDNVTNPFEGFSDGRATLKRGDKLPTGTYFYTLEYNDDNKNQVEKAGYLYINNN